MHMSTSTAVATRLPFPLVIPKLKALKTMQKMLRPSTTPPNTIHLNELFLSPF